MDSATESKEITLFKTLKHFMALHEKAGQGLECIRESIDTARILNANGRFDEMHLVLEHCFQTMKVLKESLESQRLLIKWVQHSIPRENIPLKNSIEPAAMKTEMFKMSDHYSEYDDIIYGVNGTVVPLIVCKNEDEMNCRSICGISLDNNSHIREEEGENEPK